MNHLSQELSAAARAISLTPSRVNLQSCPSVPTHADIMAAEEFRASAEGFKRAWTTAKEFGFPVGDGDLNELSNW